MRSWTVLAVLSALMVVDFVDRQVVVSMFPHLREAWGLSDRELGALASIVAAMVAAGAIPIAYLADRTGRVATIASMALVWSAATIACAFAQTYAQLLAARAVVGLGEAAYGAAGAALLATLFPARLRSTVLGIFLSCALFGSVIGVALGGILADRYGWRTGFGVAGVPGIALAILFAWLARGDRAIAAAGRVASRPVRAVVAALARPRTMLLACLGGGLQLVVVSSVYAWLPSYFHRYHAQAPADAGVRTALVILAAALGTIAWSVAADRLAQRRPGARLHVAASSALVSAVLFAVAFGAMAPGPGQVATIVAGAAAMTGTIGPVATVVVEVVPADLRATAGALLVLVQNLVGLASGPMLAGFLSDRFGLAPALAIVPAFGVAAAALLAWTAPRYEADVTRIGDTIEGWQATGRS